MEISINTPALLFPAITLLMLAYTNRFLGLASLIRNLHVKYKQIQEDREKIRAQITNLRRRCLCFPLGASPCEKKKSAKLCLCVCSPTYVP